MTHTVQKATDRGSIVVSSFEEADQLATCERVRGRGEFPARILPVGCSVEPAVVADSAEFQEAIEEALEMSPEGEAQIYWPE